MPKSKAFFLILLFFIFGIFLGKYLILSFYFKSFLFLILIILISLFWKNLNIRIFSFFVLFLFLGISHYHFFDTNSLENDEVRFYHNQKISFQGIVVSEPEIDKDKQKLVIKVKEVNLLANGSESQEWQKTQGKILVFKTRYPEYEYGDLINFQGTLKSPNESFEKEPETSKEKFNYSNYLSQFKIYSLCFYPKNELVKKNQGNLIFSLLLKGKKKFEQSLESILPNPESSFLAALLIGARQSMPEDLINIFNLIGISHIIALSGFNIMIISRFVERFLAEWLSRKISFFLSLILIVLFILMAGAQASLIRAGIMAIFVLLAQNFTRLSSIKNALIFACAIMLILNPKILFFDLGFQLSFLATCGLIWLSPLIEKYFRFVPKIFSLREYIVATFSALIFVYPVLAYSFSRISLVAPLANILVLPFIPLTMFFGFVSGFLGMISMFLGQITGLISFALLRYILEISKLCAKIPFASLEIKEFPLFLMIVCYLIIFFWMFFLKRSFLKK